MRSVGATPAGNDQPTRRQRAGPGSTQTDRGRYGNEVSSVPPIIDISPLRNEDPDKRLWGPEALETVAAIDAACRDSGFFLITGHGVDPTLMHDLDRVSRKFFALSESEKETVAMHRGGSSWRGWFPLGGELTNGKPDGKEGLYLGAELSPTDPRVVAGLPLHGPNLFPSALPELAPIVVRWLDSMTNLGHLLLRAVGQSLGVGPTWFRDNLTADPVTLFRIFHYPPDWGGEWGVAEHTDYGLLTILMQDDCGGLQVRAPSPRADVWHDVVPVAGSFVCNIGDMLERISAGRYTSTPHRVANVSGRQRLSFPFFFDPSWDARVQVLPADQNPPGAAPGHATATAGTLNRWDGASVFDFDGIYGDYLTAKVAKVFPSLFAAVAGPVQP